MIIIGCDYHPAFQQIAFVDTDTGELQERRLRHREEAEKFYRDLAAQGMKVRVGMEASGHARWFERLLAELNIELWIGDAAEIRRKRERKQKTEAGARSAWHTHPFGQILIVTEGTGWIQQWGGPIEEIRKGDVIWIPAGVKHWHGATPNTAMTHIAIQEELNGKAVEWMEKVTDEQYHK